MENTSRLFPLLLLAFIPLSGLAAEERYLAVPVHTIYMNDIILERHLVMKPFIYKPDGSSAFVEGFHDAVGKTPKRTLLARKPIPFSALQAARDIVSGDSVSILYERNGISISTAGTSLQDGHAGQTIRVRNNDTGITLDAVVVSPNQVRISGR